ncbi:MAG: class I SAM-dependent methyltransferase [Vicinamibacteraceae bacterium]
MTRALTSLIVAGGCCLMPKTALAQLPVISCGGLRGAFTAVPAFDVPQEWPDDAAVPNYGMERVPHGDGQAQQPAGDSDRWNRILSDPNSTFFNRQPNEFLTRMARSLTPGRALDVGMGQGRNAVWLATQGWQVTGFDPAKDAVALAGTEAKRAGVPLTAIVTTDDEFAWGRERWDLILMTYVDVRSNVTRAIEALAPGGVVIVEGTHRDTLKIVPRIGEAVLFGDNELIQLFGRSGLRVLHYEDVAAPSDFGDPGKRPLARTVRLMAQKPAP